MKTLPPSLFQFLGYLTNGDIAEITIYTSKRKRLVFFPKTYPKKPATYNQTLNRNRFLHIGLRWRNMPQSLRDKWLALAPAANATVTGYNLFTYYMTGKNPNCIVTLERQTGISVIAETGDPIPHPIA